MCSHDLFDADCCNVASGWEKGWWRRTCRTAGDRVLSEVLALVPMAGLDALLVAVELVLEHVTPSGQIRVEHVRNVLARLSDPQRPPSADTVLALREASRADTHRYDRLRAADTQEVGHAS